MRKLWILACSLALVATAGLAQPPGGDSVTLAPIFAPSTPGEGCAPPESGPANEKVFAAAMEKATCTAYCGGTASVNCSYTPPSTCVAVDSNCPTTRGYVTCNGVTTYCPVCPAPCNEGSFRYLWLGDCCSEGGKERRQQQCVSGQWVDTGAYICTGLCGPIDPI